MSVQAMAWAMDQDTVQDHTARHVLLILANYADHRGCSAHPAVATVARQTGLSDRAVQMKVADLLELGVIRLGNPQIVAANINRTDRRPNVYDLVMDGDRGESCSPRDDDGVNAVRPAKTARGAKRSPRQGATGCKPCTSGVQTVQERGEQFAPEPSKNHPKEPSIPPIVPPEPVSGGLVLVEPRAPTKQKKRASTPPTAVGPTIPEWVPLDPWNRWIEHRQAKDGKKFTAGAISVAVARMLKFRAEGEDLAEILDEAVLRNWSGLFSLRKGKAITGPQAARVMNRDDRLARERIEQLQTEGGYFDD